MPKKKKKKKDEAEMMPRKEMGMRKTDMKAMKMMKGWK